VIRHRPFRNTDPPNLVKLWNRVIPDAGAVRPLRVHELDVHAFGSVYFDRAGLIVAEADGQAVGFVHAGFGPDLPVAQHPPLCVGHALGTVAMLVVEPGPTAADVARGLVLEAERYLRAKGAKVIYAGGQWPLNPFYWGLYGGSECSGVLPAHPLFTETLLALGYEPASTVVTLELPLDGPEPRDPRAVLIRRQTELEIEEDVLPSDWWQNQALSDFHLARFRLLARSDGAEIARMSTFDMSWFGRADGRARLGLIDVEVAPGERRKGHGRFLVSEVVKWAREHDTALVEVQTLASNERALAFYDSIGFHPIDQSTVYRLPAPLLDRGGGPSPA
jgi:GNAT superfamily N-acetyltransferase